MGNVNVPLGSLLGLKVRAKWTCGTTLVVASVVARVPPVPCASSTVNSLHLFLFAACYNTAVVEVRTTSNQEVLFNFNADLTGSASIPICRG